MTPHTTWNVFAFSVLKIFLVVKNVSLQFLQSSSKTARDPSVGHDNTQQNISNTCICLLIIVIFIIIDLFTLKYKSGYK